MTKKEENAENICHWNACLTQYPSAEELFNHVCSTHIGRKSAGTLSLECQWTGCQARASKRDHLTSHCRVHIALKPHVCSICTKAFKRPQDLKKHEKIHTEEHHATHKQAKAIIAPVKSTTSSVADKQTPAPQPPTFGIASHNQPLLAHPDAKSHLQQQQPYPFSFPTIGYPYPFLPQGQVGANGIPAQSVDQLAQFIALQQQLNSQAQAAASQGYPVPGLTGVLPPGYPIPLAQNPYGLAAGPGLSFVPQNVYPLANHYAFSAPGQQPPQYAQVLPLQQQSQHRNSSVSSAPPTSVTSTPAPSSLYPSLSSNLFPAPAALSSVKAEDHPSPAQSYKSQYSSISSPSGVPALSPPSLSTPENSYSPTPELENDTYSARRAYSGNAVAGKKRGFDEAAEHFLGDLRNKRFHDQDTVNDQLDALSTFLLSPEMAGPPALTPGRDDSSSSSGSEYGRHEGSFDREEVDTINQLLLSLGQSIDSDPAALQSTQTDTDPYMFSHHPDQAHMEPSLASMQHNPSSASLYPVLPGLAKGASSLPYPYGSTPHTYPTAPNHDHSNLRLAKPPSAPTISNDYRQTHYQHVARLQRAAPTEPEAMEVDAEMAEAAAALLMGKSSVAPKAATAAAPRPKLPSLAMAIQSSHDGPQLAPITTALSSSAPPTLPHIRDLVSLSPRRASFNDTLDSPSSPTTSNGADFASPPPPFRSMYPSLASTPSTTSSSTPSRPLSAGGVERLTHRVHKMRLPSTSSETSTDHTETGSLLDTEDLSASSDEDDEDHPNARFKKSRIMASPESMTITEVKEEPEDEEEDVKPDLDLEESAAERRDVEERRKIAEKRKATIAYLVGYVNAKYRAALAKRSVVDLRKAIRPTSPLCQVEA
ncbi:alkaline-responsive transcriptional regulator RIM101 [Sporobolomyces koalae]|uniref:alkaline-responsive transcriptional regulator RIM101 n=1 Tax=Sporobolomyces koalae TaxID=500713 RepID=UPI00317E1BBC